MARRDERSPASSRVVESPAIHRSSAGPGMAVHRQPVVQDDIVERIWRLFCSMRLALILILVITAAVFVGTLLDQTPGALSPSDYASWLSRARLKYGNFTDLLSALQLFIIFSSLWFKLLLSLLLMNIVVCTSNRWKGIWTTIAHPRVRMSESFFLKAGRRAEIKDRRSPAEAVGEVVETLRRHRYRVLVENGPTGIHLYADKNRWFRLGTLLTHLSFVVLLVGLLLFTMFERIDPHVDVGSVPQGARGAFGDGE